MLLIGFGHKARQGKDTAAGAVFDALPFECVVRRYKYADALWCEIKKVIRECGTLKELVTYGFLDDNREYVIHVPDWVKSEAGKPRTFLQWWGTNYRRAQDPDYWVKRMAEVLDKAPPEVGLITDVRFPNEADFIKSRGGYLVKCVRTTKPDVAVPAHDSENMLDGYTGWDFTIQAANVSECEQQAVEIYRKIVRKRGE